MATKLTKKERDLLESKSVASLPDNPSNKGFSAEQIKRKQYEPSLILFDWLSRLIDETDSEFEDIIDGTITVEKAKRDANGDEIASTYETKTGSEEKLQEAKGYTDNLFSQCLSPEALDLKADKVGPLPKYEVNGTDNVVDFITNNSINGKAIILKTSGQAITFSGLYIGSFSKVYDNFYTFEFELIGSTVRISGSVDMQGKTFADVFNRTEYLKAYQIANLTGSLSASSTNTQYPSAKCVYDQLLLKENVSNKVTALSGSSTDTQYPSAKVVYDNIQNIREIAEGKCKTLCVPSNILRIENNKLYYKSGNSEQYYPSNTISGVKVYNHETKKWVTSTLSAFEGVIFANPNFGLQDDSFYISGWSGMPASTYTQQYIVVGKFSPGNILYIYPISRQQSTDALDLKTGDIFLVYATNVPDRWVEVYGTGITFNKLETSKLDLNQYYTKDQIAALFGSYLTSPYDNTSTYAVGKYVTYNGALYRCITAIDVAEDFDSNKWTAVSVGSELERMVTTDTEQTITGEKTFTVKLTASGGVDTWQIIRQGTQRLYFDQWNATVSARTILPLTNADNIGSSSSPWKDIYSSGVVYIGALGTSYITNQGNNNLVYTAVWSHQFRGNVIPFTDNTYDLGSDDSNTGVKYFRNLYLAGKVNPNASGYGLTFPNTSGFAADKELATSDIVGMKDYGTISSQTSSSIIDEIKTYGGVFKIGNNTIIKFPDTSRTGADSTLAIKIATTGQGGNLSIGVGYINSTVTDFVLSRTIWTGVAHSNANDTIATQNLRVNGAITDGTNSVAVADIYNGIFNIIVKNSGVTFTDDEYALIINGKPTIIQGSLLGFDNPILVSCKDLYGNGYGLLIGNGSSTNKTIVPIGFSGSNHTAAVMDNQYANFHIKGITNFNGKSVPSYPSLSSGDIQKQLIYKDDNTLAWDNVSGFKVIDAPSSTTLTDDEITNIIGGAVVKDTISGISGKRDFIFFPANLYSGSYYGFLVCSDIYGSEYIGQYNITQNTKVLTIFPSTQIANSGIIFNTTINQINSKKVVGYYLNNVYQHVTLSGTELKYEEINDISISADTTFTLATAPTDTYPEYKANITNTDTSNAITITLPSGTVIKGNVTISGNTFEIPADSSVEVNIQNGKAIVVEW